MVPLRRPGVARIVGPASGCHPHCNRTVPTLGLRLRPRSASNVCRICCRSRVWFLLNDCKSRRLICVSYVRGRPLYDSVNLKHKKLQRSTNSAKLPDVAAAAETEPKHTDGPTRHPHAWAALQVRAPRSTKRGLRRGRSAIKQHVEFHLRPGKELSHGRAFVPDIEPRCTSTLDIVVPEHAHGPVDDSLWWSVPVLDRKARRRSRDLPSGARSCLVHILKASKKRQHVSSPTASRKRIRMNSPSLFGLC